MTRFEDTNEALFIESLPLSIRSDIQLRIARTRPDRCTLTVLDATEFVMVDLDVTDLGNLIGILEMAEQIMLKNGHTEK